MTTVEDRDIETTTRMALAAIEQMFDEAMSCIGVLCEGFPKIFDEEDADDKQDSEVRPVQEDHPTEEIAGQAAA